ncbi:hypothetical protein F5Y17DRAFT_52052 [Xylariaceae sp. FL0594]|nr:hypothetical protein F5Y17DRAFT_52052 [Xylariaceae sp. FL0594]
MDPITKVWLFTLNARHSIIQATFSGFWNETLMIAASYTTERGEPHTLYQCREEPDLLAVVCGYHSLQASIDAEKALGERLAPHFFDFITHKELYILNMDVRDLPLTEESGEISIVSSDTEPKDAAALPGKGDWALQPDSIYLGPVDKDKLKKTWIHIATAGDAEGLSPVGKPRTFHRIMEAHIASKAA